MRIAQAQENREEQPLEANDPQGQRADGAVQLPDRRTMDVNEW